MILYLRDQNNKTITDTEITIKTEDNYQFVEVDSAISIPEYSKHLLNSDIKNTFIKDIDFISEIRGWMWEYYFATKKNTKDEYQNVLNEIRKVHNEIAIKHKLMVVED